MKKLGRFLYLILVLILFWLVGTSIAYRFLNPYKTETEIFIHIPKSFILDFESK